MTFTFLLSVTEWNFNLKNLDFYTSSDQVCIFQAYHNAHLEAIKGFGMHGYEIDFEVLVEEYQVEESFT